MAVGFCLLSLFYYLFVTPTIAWM